MLRWYDTRWGQVHLEHKLLLSLDCINQEKQVSSSTQIFVKSARQQKTNTYKSDCTGKWDSSPIQLKVKYKKYPLIK